MTDPDDSLRVSDAERDATLRLLSEHAAVGRLTLDELEDIIAEIEKADITVHGHGALKSAPRGYPADHPRITLLRYKGLTAWRQWPVGPWLESAQAKGRVVSFLRTTQPLCSWLADHVRR